MNCGKSSPSILLGIRRSVRGTAAEVLRYLGEQVIVQDVLDKFDVTFGNVLSTEQLLGSFYSVTQKPSESVTSWGCRLEEILSQLQERGAIQPSARRNMLWTKFWMGLTEEKLKNASRHRFDSGESYDQLFRSLRTLEQEQKPYLMY